MTRDVAFGNYVNVTIEIVLKFFIKA